MRFALERVALPLHGSQFVREPILDIDLVRQARDGQALVEIAVQQLVCDVAETCDADAP